MTSSRSPFYPHPLPLGCLRNIMNTGKFSRMPQIQAPVLPASLEHMRELGFPDIIGSMILGVKGILNDAPRLFLTQFLCHHVQSQKKATGHNGIRRMSAALCHWHGATAYTPVSKSLSPNVPGSAGRRPRSRP